jgi:hypothetical protein
MKNTISCTLVLCTVFFAPQKIAAEPSSPTQTQPAAIDSELPFDRLFTTPQERKALNSQRRIHGFINPTSGQDNADEEKKLKQANTYQPHESIKFSGVLIRADGQQQVWINGKLANDQPGFKTKQIIQGDKQHSATIKIPLRANQAILKPGQVWVPTSKKVGESYLLLNTPKKEALSVTPEEASPVTPEETSPATPENESPKVNTEPTTTTQ